jgi:MFS family permease
MVLYTFVISYSFLSTSLINYALIFNMEHLSGSIFVSTILFGIFRYAMNLLIGSLDFFIPRAGRKPILYGALVYILLMLLVVIVSKVAGNPKTLTKVGRFLDFHDTNLLRVTTLTAAAICSQCYMISGLVTNELFPTAIRNLAVSFVQISNRLGAVLSPYLFFLVSEKVHKTAIQCLGHLRRFNSLCSDVSYSRVECHSIWMLHS